MAVSRNCKKRVMSLPAGVGGKIEKIRVTFFCMQISESRPFATIPAISGLETCRLVLPLSPHRRYSSAMLTHWFL